MRAARSNFAANLFGCAGLPCVTRQFSTTDAIATADAGLIVLCSSDAEYLELGRELMSKLTELRRNTPVLIAGNPDSADQLRTAGVTDFVHIRTNPIEFLAAWQLRLGIEE
jgi:methylmalonyl-CoA mutase